MSKKVKANQVDINRVVGGYYINKYIQPVTKSINIFNLQDNKDVTINNNFTNLDRYLLDKKSELQKIETSTGSSNTVALIDFLNLIRKNISDRPEAKFQSVEEFIENITTIAHKIKNLGDFKQIFLVTKSFKFNDNIKYYDVLKIIIWCFCKAIPEWIDKIRLVLVNGINDKDKEADDRALFILYNEYSITMESPVIIVSGDNFDSLKSHFLRYVTLNFYYPKVVGDTWNETKICSQYSARFRQDKKKNKNSYIIVHPNTNKTSFISIA